MLRPFTRDDLQELTELIDRERYHLAPWMPWAVGADANANLEYLEQQWALEEQGKGLMRAVVLDGRIAGSIGFQHVDPRHRSAAIGYWLAAAAQGRGVMTQAVAELLDHAFGPWELHRIELCTAPDNARSRALAERLGFTQEGIAREAERFSEGYRDLVVHSLLAHEWRGATQR